MRADYQLARFLSQAIDEVAQSALWQAPGARYHGNPSIVAAEVGDPA